ncbi:MAG: hypothetical protein HRU00_14670 [Myxococcales bacterium]|nr:hypothetical protein [Myxococcales bacterium]
MLWWQRGTALGAAWMLALACGGAPARGPAAACAAVVKQVRDLPNPVEVVGPAERSSEGNLEIRYASTNAENIPVAGKALCEFAVGDGGALQLVSAQVDGSELDTAAIASINRRKLPAMEMQ